ncbi:MAG: hypothetical protein WB523_09460 [Candidatus Sulfotelmatobacter sp.]
MHRLTARFLLFFALVGSLAPLALAVTVPPPHACCFRKGIHHCHESMASESGQPVIQDASCCRGDCCRAVTTAQWAHPQPKLAAFFLQAHNLRLVVSEVSSPAAACAEFQSTRAPPAC